MVRNFDIEINLINFYMPKNDSIYLTSYCTILTTIKASINFNCVKTVFTDYIEREGTNVPTTLLYIGGGRSTRSEKVICTSIQIN